MNAEQVLIIGAVDCNDRVNTILSSWQLGVTQRTASEQGGPHLYAARTGPVDTSGLVESRFQVLISADSVDEVMAIYSAIEAELAALSDITVGFKGSAYTATMTPKVAACTEIPQSDGWDVILAHAHKTKVEIVVRRDPYLRTSAETLADDAVTLPAVVSLSAMVGDGDADLDTLLDFDDLEATRVFAGHYPDPLATIADFARELVAAAWVDVSGTGAAASDDAGYGTAVGGNKLWGTEGVCYTDLIFTDLKHGEYHLIVNAKTADAGDPGTIHHPYCDPVTITGTTLHWYSLGTVTLPPSAVRGSADSTLRLTLTGKGAGNAVYANAVFAIPVSFGGVVGWRRASGHAHTIAFEDGVCYADDAGALGEALSPGPVRARGGSLLIVAEQATPAPTTAADLTLTYEPLWEQLPSA